ncbi:uncharacterized protein M6G45_012371 [Spheniscus humboldti]
MCPLWCPLSPMGDLQGALCCRVVACPPRLDSPACAPPLAVDGDGEERGSRGHAAAGRTKTWQAALHRFPEVAWIGRRHARIVAANRLLELTASWDAREPFPRVGGAVCRWEPQVLSFGVDSRYKIIPLGSSASSLSPQTKPEGLLQPE